MTFLNGFAVGFTPQGGNYQTLINDALREYMAEKWEPLEDTLRRVVREELRKQVS